MRGWGPFIESKTVADRLVQLSSSNEMVYVAGSEPQILYYAHRFSPTRFVIAYPLMIPTPLALGYQQEIIRDLQQRPPPFIVAARTPTSWMLEEKTPKLFPDYLQDLLGKKYEAVGGYVYDVQGGLLAGTAFGRAKPAGEPDPFQTKTPLKKSGGRNWIRTNEGVSQQIYSLPPLATWVSYQPAAHIAGRVLSQTRRRLSTRRRACWNIPEKRKSA